MLKNNNILKKDFAMFYFKWYFYNIDDRILIGEKVTKYDLFLNKNGTYSN